MVSATSGATAVTAKEYLTPEEAGALLKVHPKTIIRMCTNGQLRYRKVGRGYRVERESLLAATEPEGAGASSATPVPTATAVVERPASVARVIALANQKGGVGKTTTAVNLSAALAERGCTTLLVDLDPQANATMALTGGQMEIAPSLREVLVDKVPPDQVLRPTPQEGASLLPSSIMLASVERQLAEKVARERVLVPVVRSLLSRFDFILLDCPPTLGLLTVAALTAAGEVIVPVRAHYFSVAGLSQLFDTIGEVREELDRPDLRITGILVNQGSLDGDGQPRSVTYRESVDALARSPYGQYLFATRVPDATAIERAHRMGMSVMRWQPNGPIAEAYRQLAQEVIDRG